MKNNDNVDKENIELQKVSIDEASVELICTPKPAPFKDYWGALESERQINPKADNLPYLYKCLGDYYIDQNDYPKAAKCFAIALELDPYEELVNLLVSRGLISFDEKSILKMLNSTLFRRSVS
jgi:tetratricopeptide (TPR) repeat protein